MKKVLIAILATVICAAFPAAAQQFKVTDKVKLGGEGGWDYLTYDKDGQAAVHHSWQPCDGG